MRRLFQEVQYKSMANRNYDISPHENDILMGRGGKNNQHVGNENLRGLARLQCENYRLASKKGKSYISRQLVQQVRQLSPPGRFLKKNHGTGVWEDVGDDVAREKASQVLRDAVSFATLPKMNETSENHHHCESEETFSNTRRVSSAPPTVKAVSRRRHWDEITYSTPPPYDHQLNMITPSLYHVSASLSQYDSSAKRPRYHRNRWDEQSVGNSYHPGAQLRYSFQADYTRSLPTSPAIDNRSAPEKPAPRLISKVSAQTHTSLDEFDLFNGELLNSDEEGVNDTYQVPR